MDKGKISSLQMALMMYPAIVATAILGIPSIAGKYAKNDLWLSPVLGSLIGFATVIIVYKLHKLFPKETVIQFSGHIVGRFWGKLVGFIMIFFYIHAIGLIIRAYADFVVDSFLVRTPLIMIISSMMFLCALIVIAGVEVLGRAAQLFMPLFVVPLLLLVFLLFPDLEFMNIFPILSEGMMPVVKGAIVPGAWFTEFFLIAFLLPFVSDQKNKLKYGLWTVVVVMITLMLVNLVVLMVLGPTTSSKVYPLMNVARYVSISNFFEHLESVVMAIWVVGAFIKISVFYYVAALGTAQWLNLSDYRTVIWPIGILGVALSYWSLPSAMALTQFLIGTFPPYALIVQVILPLLLLGIAWLRKLKPSG